MVATDLSFDLYSSLSPKELDLFSAIYLDTE